MALVSKSVPGKILACWLPITAFQALGMEHIVVNMFLHTTGPLLGSGVSFGQVAFWNYLPVTIGKFRRNGLHRHAFLQHPQITDQQRVANGA